MTTSHVDRQVLRDWRDNHDDVQPDRDGGRGRPFCQPCMVERIRLWSAVELGEVPA